MKFVEDTLSEGLDSSDVIFERLKSVAHEGYRQARGSFSGNEVTVTEKDESYHVQIRGEEIYDFYIESENPRDELPENRYELYNLLSSIEV